MGEIVMVALATYGVATLVSEYDGVFDVFSKLRSNIKAFRCVPCATVWIAIPIAVIMNVGVIGYLASVGISIALDRFA